MGSLQTLQLVRRWSRRTYATYARYWVDGARLPYQSAPANQARMWIRKARTNLRAAMADGQGSHSGLPHVGSWEWGGAWLALEEMPMTAVVERLEPPQLFEWFLSSGPAWDLPAFRSARVPAARCCVR